MAASPFIGRVRGKTEATDDDDAAEDLRLRRLGIDPDSDPLAILEALERMERDAEASEK